MGCISTPAPRAALPTETFPSSWTLNADGDCCELALRPPAHTDTDIFVHFTKANVLHMGDVFFNGVYPFIDAGTGGNINGMIGGATRGCRSRTHQTKIVPGHGPLGDKAALQRADDMLVTVRDRVQALKAREERWRTCRRPSRRRRSTRTWGKGFMQPDDFVTLVYSTL